MTWAAAAGNACNDALVAWFIAAILQRTPWRNAITHTVWAELKPFYLPTAVAGYVLDSIAAGNPVDAIRIVTLGLQVCGWLMCRNGDDDRWRRRRRKLAEKVERRGARLIVAAQGGR